MDSLCLRLALPLIIGCGPAVPETDDEDAGTSEAEEGSTGTEASTSTTAGTSTTTTGPATTSTTGTVSTASTDPDTGSDDGSDSSSGGDPGFEPRCRDDGPLAISVSGTNQEHEGRLVWLSAVEPDPDAFDEHHLVVHLRTSIADGAFELSCPTGLTENNWYPSFAVVIDADDDGVCSDGDLTYVSQQFGWVYDQLYAFDGASLYSLENEPPWLVTEDAWHPVEGMTGFSGEPLCTYFFP